MPKTQARRTTEERREEIARAVLELIGERGAGALTAARIAERVGVTSGALFRHFASVEDMLVAAVEQAAGLVEASLPTAEAAPLERIEALVHSRVDLVRAHPGLAWMLLSDQSFLALPEPGVRRLSQVIEATRSFLDAALEEAASRGQLAAGLDPAALRVICIGTIHALARGSQPREGAHGRTAVVSALIQLLKQPDTKP
ncbi:MAG: TetR/AcrR family transcriptional regulator [Planctomycetota bacterium]|nr:TetR/AcrR family transcriptional regulator [Planctomycetota bacterium]